MLDKVSLRSCDGRYTFVGRPFVLPRSRAALSLKLLENVSSDLLNLEMQSTYRRSGPWSVDVVIVWSFGFSGRTSGTTGATEAEGSDILCLWNDEDRSYWYERKAGMRTVDLRRCVDESQKVRRSWL